MANTKNGIKNANNGVNNFKFWHKKHNKTTNFGIKKSVRFWYVCRTFTEHEKFSLRFRYICRAFRVYQVILLKFL